MAACTRWVDSLSSMGRLNKAQETQLEGKFAGLLEEVLDYRLVPGPDASLWPKPPTAYTGLSGTPDLALGDFGDIDAAKFEAVLELKGPGTDLDRRQVRRTDEFSPVEQAFDYATQLLVVRWVLVSDMRILRLYAVGDSSVYMEFDFAACHIQDNFRRLWWLLSAGALLGQGNQAPVDALLVKSAEQRIALSQGFYEGYTQIRSDLYLAVRDGCIKKGILSNRDELLEATQRLLDRMIFLYYCEDHPQRLIDHDTVSKITEQAAAMPGTSTSRVYDTLKALFREVDIGSPATSGLRLNAYNGELFKLHPIIDTIDLPDELHRNVYKVKVGASDTRKIAGAWGLHVFDFWRELDEHMLGKIFEESLSDLIELGASGQVDLAARLRERKRGGIFYTHDLLAEFATYAPLAAVVDERAREIAAMDGVSATEPETRLAALMQVQIIDLACGSGAFVVSAYRQLLAEFWRLQDLLTPGPSDLFNQASQATQAALLRNCIYGLDLLPQAVDITKLALWLRSARRDEKVPDLSQNFAAVDSLDLGAALNRLGLQPGAFDLVIGNPPWGGEMKAASYAKACLDLGLDPERKWDSWELFLLLGVRALRPGGRLSLVLPDSLLYEAKAPIRRELLENTCIVRLHSLGAGWFGPHVRMSTMVLDLRNESPGLVQDITSLVLAGSWRKSAQTGRLPLRQIEAQRSRQVPQDRASAAPSRRIEIFRGRLDDTILATIVANSVPLQTLTDRRRGEEVNRAGLYWTCPSCLGPTVPGRKVKGSYEDKRCQTCGAAMSASTAGQGTLVGAGLPAGPGTAPWISGSDLTRRYQSVVPSSRIRTDVDGWVYKGLDYGPEKVIIRQAGVGLMASLDRTGAWVPQSVYLYRLKSQYLAAGWNHEFLLGALLSRTLAYVFFKSFSEIDPDKAHAKVTHARLATLPIPQLDLGMAEVKADHDAVVAGVRELLAGGAALGSRVDWQVETILRRLWGLSGDDGAYINSEFADLPEGQAVRDLFPEGAPARPRNQIVTA